MEHPTVTKLIQEGMPEKKPIGYCASCQDVIYEGEKHWLTRDGYIHDTRDCKKEQMYKEYKISQIVDEFKDKINKLSTKEFLLDFVDDYKLIDKLISLTEDYDWVVKE